MGEILITFEKQSAAFALMRAMDRERMRAKIVQTPAHISAGGCSYGVTTKRSNLSKIIALCRRYNINYRRIFSIYTYENGQKEYSQI